LISRLQLLILFLLYPGCVTESDPNERNWEITLLYVHNLNIEDPSGLTVDASGDFLWTVSDMEGGHIYKISFEGHILERLPYEGDDMEGITMNPNDHTLWVAEERLRQAVQLDTLGNVLQVVNVPVESTNINDGLEGIAINPENEHLYILNEKNPRAFIELNREMEVVRYELLNFEMPYFMQDLGGLFFDHINDHFWVVSDESAKIVVMDKNLNPFQYFDLPLTKFEGIAIDLTKDIIYLVNDEENKLYVYQLE
jgi:uncharacterized protein YjiK